MKKRGAFGFKGSSLALLGVFALGAISSPIIFQNAIAVTAEAPAAVGGTPNQQIPESMPIVDEKIIAQVASLGEITDQRVVPARPGMIAWHLKAKNGQKVTAYTTADGLLIMGGIWDLATKIQLNENFNGAAAETQAPVPAAQSTEMPTAQVGTDNGSFVGPFTGPTPTSIKAIDERSGVKLGKGDMNDTLYVMVDPRCPYCHQAYENLKPYMDKGLTVKIIPTVALGNPTQGAPMANAMLKATNRTEMDAIMADPTAHTAPLNDADKTALDTNLAFLFAAFEQAKQKPGVPAAFFVDRKTGKGRLVMGLSEQNVVKEVLGDL